MKTTDDDRVNNPLYAGRGGVAAGLGVGELLTVSRFHVIWGWILMNKGFFEVILKVGM